MNTEGLPMSSVHLLMGVYLDLLLPFLERCQGSNSFPNGDVWLVDDTSFVNSDTPLVSSATPSVGNTTSVSDTPFVSYGTLSDSDTSISNSPVITMNISADKETPSKSIIETTSVNNATKELADDSLKPVGSNTLKSPVKESSRLEVGEMLISPNKTTPYRKSAKPSINESKHSPVPTDEEISFFQTFPYDVSEQLYYQLGRLAALNESRNKNRNFNPVAQDSTNQNISVNKSKLYDRS
ncbi:Hypothetical predicted protein [Mytilus galloprovincialis]|uniref:Uncharacterized protein n=1 Tax=Mytilus galloprovincialis TaxID=29158 RepID=A0A8B6EA16_MYTGA|nr:Hypothetical predicted protein [Mytilus galloprovincialis]